MLPETPSGPHDGTKTDRSAWLAFVGRPLLILFAVAALGMAVLVAFDLFTRG